MITLNVKDAILAGAKAFEEGRLAANKPVEALGCSYRAKDGTPCLIGAAISDEDWERNIEGRKIDGERANEMLIESLIRMGVITLDMTGVKGTEAAATDVLQALQYRHDDVVQTGGQCRQNQRRKLARRLKAAVKAVEQGKLPKVD